MNYYVDVDRREQDILVRCGGSRLEYLQRSDPGWKQVWKGSSYYREIFLGQGNNCLFPISGEEVERVAEQWRAAEKI